MSQRADLVELLSGKPSILLDFDGPVCSPEKVDRFTDAQADIVITSMAEVASALVELRL